MAQQRARVLAMRARKLAERKAAEALRKRAEQASKELKPTFSASGAKLQKPTARLKGLFTASGAKLVKPGVTKKAEQKETSKAAKPSPKAQPSTSTTTGGKKPVQPVQTKSRVPQRFADGGKGGKYDKAVQNKEKAKSNFFRSSSGTRGDNVPSNPKLKSQPKKPLRKDFPAGRAGALRYAAAMTKYRNLLKRVPKVPAKTNRRGRRI